MPITPSEKLSFSILRVAVLLLLADAHFPAPAADLVALPSRITLLPVTSWCYSSGNSRIILEANQKCMVGIVSYEIGGAGPIRHTDEKIDTFTTINSTRHGQRKLLVFSLVKDKKWSDEFTEEITSHVGASAE